MAKYAKKNADGSVHASETWDPALKSKELKGLQNNYERNFLHFALEM